MRHRTRFATATLADGDQLAIHVDEPANRTTGPLAILIHGLAGCHASGYVDRTASKLVAHGFTAIRVDLRGCGAGWNLARGAFHAARSSDIGDLIQSVTMKFSGVEVLLVGFSLGGHLVLKYLSEIGDRVPGSLRAALAVAPPLNLARCTSQVRRCLGGLYDRYFAHMLWRHYQDRMKAGLLPDLHVARPGTLFDFDDQITAPLAGFASAQQYYAAASAHEGLERICLPTDVITAADDPMVPVEMIRAARMPNCMRLHVVPTGGHLGFIADRRYPGPLSPGVLPDRRWLDWQVVEWARQATLFACDAR